jgi:cystathionine beta-lyase
LPSRLKQQSEQALQVAKWLKGRPEVGRVLHPALPDCPGHEHWRRDYQGASSLFGFTLRSNVRDAASAFIDRMRLFGIGASWGGYESLMIPAYAARLRTATKWPEDEFLIRIHIGLENKDDLIADLEMGFGRMRLITHPE